MASIKSNADILAEKLANFLTWQKGMIIADLVRLQESQVDDPPMKAMLEALSKAMDEARKQIQEVPPQQAFNIVQQKMLTSPRGFLRVLADTDQDDLTKFQRIMAIHSANPQTGILEGAPDLSTFGEEADKIKLARYLTCFALLTTDGIDLSVYDSPPASPIQQTTEDDLLPNSEELASLDGMTDPAAEDSDGYDSEEWSDEFNNDP